MGINTKGIQLTMGAGNLKKAPGVQMVQLPFPTSIFNPVITYFKLSPALYIQQLLASFCDFILALISICSFI